MPWHCHDALAEFLHDAVAELLPNEVTMRGFVAGLALALALIGALPMAQAAQSIDFGRYHALVIGINHYKYLPKLKTAINDASAVHDTLRQKYGFESTLLLNPNRYDLMRALSNVGLPRSSSEEYFSISAPSLARNSSRNRSWRSPEVSSCRLPIIRRNRSAFSGSTEISIVTWATMVWASRVISGGPNASGR